MKTQIENKCKLVNAEFLASLTADTTRWSGMPLTISSRVCYIQHIGPIEMGFRDEYLNNEFDDILSKYHKEIYEAYEQREIEYNKLHPTISWKDFMGEEFSADPLPTLKELEKFALKESKSMTHIKTLKLPEELYDHAASKIQTRLGKILLAIKEHRYIITDKEANYKVAWDKKEDEYWALVKKEDPYEYPELDE